MRHIVGLLIAFCSVVSAKEDTFSLGEAGSVHYVWDDEQLLYIERRSLEEDLIYRHSYHYNTEGYLVSESLIGDLGEIIYSKSGVITSPYHTEICEYNENLSLIRHNQDGVIKEYSYNDVNELITEDFAESFEYDIVGNIACKGDVSFTYDQDNRLVSASSPDFEVVYTYDNKGRRISKTVNGEQEIYGHLGPHEIVIFNSMGQVEQLRIPGLSYHKDLIKAVAIETKDAIYAPIHDIQANIVKLIDIHTKEVISLDLADPFGNGLSKNAPTSWIFSGKYYDKELNLVYFGDRYYSPTLKRWLSPDPARQTSDLYQYCLNNPLSYFDPDGRFFFAIPLVWAGGVALGELLLQSAVIAGTGWVTSEVIKKGNEWYDNRQMNKHRSLYELDRYYDKMTSGNHLEGHSRMENSRSKKGKQKDGIPTPNRVQNKQFKDAQKDIEKKLGRRFTEYEKEKFHDEVTKRGYDYHELVEEGYWAIKGHGQ
ncbi:MAG: RHS repeat-associated core domain-containing protein [Chlamydiota bacterium]